MECEVNLLADIILKEKLGKSKASKELERDKMHSTNIVNIKLLSSG